MIGSQDTSPGPSVAILAGGLSTRLRPLTETIPKSMIEVAGKPFIEYQLRMLVEQKLDHIVLLCGFLHQPIVDFVGDGSAFGCKVQYSFDGETQLGTGGAIRRALSLLSERFIVMYGDSYCPTRYGDIYRAFVHSDKLGLMTVFPNGNLWDTSNVEFRNDTIVRYDKKVRTPAMRHIDYGINVFSQKAFAGYAENTAFDLATLQMDLLQRRQLAGFEVSERFYEIGSPQGLAETSAFLAGSSGHLLPEHKDTP